MVLGIRNVPARLEINLQRRCPTYQSNDQRHGGLSTEVLPGRPPALSAVAGDHGSMFLEPAHHAFHLRERFQCSCKDIRAVFVRWRASLSRHAGRDDSTQKAEDLIARRPRAHELLAKGDGSRVPVEHDHPGLAETSKFE